VWPALEAAFPDAEACLAAAASQAQDMRAALDELAAADLARVADEEALHVERWMQLSPPRRSLVLRAWLRARTGQGPGEALVRRLMAELPRPGPARWPLGPQRTLQRYRGRLLVQPLQPARGGPTVELAIAGPGDHWVSEWGGALRVTPVAEGGIALSRLRRCELRPRQGGERFKAGPGRPSRPLKHQFQAQAVGPWAREVPLLYCGGRLAFVPGLGIHGDEFAACGEPQAALEWLPHAMPFAAPQ
jgi:tRNA(Ile)-lysidine synthase